MKHVFISFISLFILYTFADQEFFNTYTFNNNKCLSSLSPLSISQNYIIEACEPTIAAGHPYGTVKCDINKQQLITTYCGEDNTCTKDCHQVIQKANNCSSDNNDDDSESSTYSFFNCSSSASASLLTIPNTYVSFTSSSWGCQNTTDEIQSIEVLYLHQCQQNVNGTSQFYSCDNTSLSLNICADSNCNQNCKVSNQTDLGCSQSWDFSISRYCNL